MKFKPIPEKRKKEFYKSLDYAFRPHKEERSYDDEEDYWPIVGGEFRGLFDGGELLSVSTIIPFGTFSRGDETKIGGITTVATPPENRTRGFVREMLKELCGELRDRGIYLSVLWPFSYTFYHKLGWARSQDVVTYKVDPDILRREEREKIGRFARIKSGDYCLIEPAYLNYVENFNLPMKRWDEWWDGHLMNHWRINNYCYAWEKDGKIRGYVLYHLQEGLGQEWKRKMVVDEIVFEDRTSFEQLLNFLYSHSSQAHEVLIRAPLGEEVPFHHIFDDPREVEVKVQPGVMTRIVDVEAALGALSPPEGLHGQLRISVRDPLLDFNSGTFDLEFEDRETRCTRANDKATSPDLTVDVKALAQIYTGHLSVDQATFLGLEANQEEKLDDLRALFPPERVFFNEGF